MWPAWLWYLAIGIPLAGLVIGRWWVVGLAVLIWVGLGIFVLLNGGWYESGWGEAGKSLTVFFALVTVGGTTVAVLLRVAVRLAVSDRKGSP